MPDVVKSEVDPLPSASSPFESGSGLRRFWAKARHSAAGLRAAVCHEAGLRQELIVGVPLGVAAWWLASTPAQAMERVAVVLWRQGRWPWQT